MADKTSKFAQNAPGPYYVDDKCIACDACVVEAPLHFGMNDTEGHAYVKAQPITPEQKKACEEALAACPVEAIGNDGD